MEVMINRWFVVLFLAFLFVGCDFETNIVDPQASHSIQESAKSKVLVSIGRPTNHDVRLIKEIWIEKAWKNAIKNGKPYKEIFDSNQIVLSINKNIKYKIEDYALLWKMYNSRGDVFGSGNGALILDDIGISDSINLTLFNISDSTRIEIGSFKFYTNQ